MSFVLFWLVSLVRATLQKGYCNGKLNLGMHVRIGILPFCQFQFSRVRVQHLWKSDEMNRIPIRVHICSTFIMWIQNCFPQLKHKKNHRNWFPICFPFDHITMYVLVYVHTREPKSHALRMCALPIVKQHQNLPLCLWLSTFIDWYYHSCVTSEKRAEKTRLFIGSRILYYIGNYAGHYNPKTETNTEAPTLPMCL